jgi:RNase P/RNase MRP subunit POP5
MRPTLREKRRYIVFGVDADFEAARREILRCVGQFLGELGLSKANVVVLPECWDDSKKMGIIRCERSHVDCVKGSLAFSTLKFRTMLVTGMIKKGKTFIRRYKGQMKKG